MWTYLLIFLGLLVILIVFIRRIVLQVRAKNKKEEVQEKKEDPKKDGEDVKVSRKEKIESEKLFEKAEGMLKGGREDEAIKTFVQVLAIDPSHTDTKHKLAMLYMGKQMFSAASALFRELAEEYEDAVHYSHLGLALYNQNEFEEAKAAYQKAVSLDDSRPQRFVSLSQVYKSLGDLQNAIIALNRAVELSSENTEYLVLLGELFLEKGDHEGAEKYILEIEKISPEHEGIEYLRTAIKKSQNREEDSSKES